MRCSASLVQPFLPGVTLNPYEILQLQPGASLEEIKVAYTRQAKQWHPDRYSDVDRPRAEEQFDQLNVAFGMLKASVGTAAPTPEVSNWQPTASLSVAQAEASPAIGLAPTAARENLQPDALRAFENGHLEQALELIQKSLEVDSENFDFHSLHSKILDGLGTDKRALVQALENCLRLNKKDFDSAIRLAQIYQAMDMHLRATKYWEWARNLNPLHPHFEEKPMSSKEKAFETVGELGGQVKGLLLGAKGLFGKK